MGRVGVSSRIGIELSSTGIGIDIFVQKGIWIRIAIKKHIYNKNELVPGQWLMVYVAIIYQWISNTAVCKGVASTFLWSYINWITH